MDSFGKPPAKFNQDIFFEFMLPFLILSNGYNMKRRRFFRNIGFILLFGIVGTFIQFIFVSVAANLLSFEGTLKDGKGVTHHFSIEESLSLGALLSSSDVACILALVSEAKVPKLHSIIFGESIMNDAISILLLHTLTKVDIKVVDPRAILLFFLEFMFNCLSSILLGVLFGLISAFLTRYFSTLRAEPSKSVALQLYVCLMSYMLAQALEVSENITLMVCGIISGHYA